ncbi:STAS domain-containing protein [Kitasatospora atroaurantiaca]|uniref:Anti-sigma factor antagonist n=1 Tax=Kitasatospora atroaurantiaca TaxID=285545 RepID=A0A561EXW0_9ACTN|nr:STAS domain-containing protein [Kitasatospora atroaurantiaca]TWE20454.1 anti-sigma B factor antagonist [Kitasatospora atroaurantiaca]
MYLQLSSRRVDGWSVVHAAGELDIATADTLRDRVTALLVRDGPRARVIVDLSALVFCDASGVGALVEARNIARTHLGELRLAGPRGRVLRLLRLTELDRLMPIFPTVRDAIAATTAPAAGTRTAQPA